VKKYTNIIILCAIVLVCTGVLINYYIDFNDVFYNIGYYDDSITFANTADVHGHIVFDDDVGGYYSLDDISNIMGLPLINYFVQQERAKDEDLLLLDTGDLFHGTNEANIEKGQGVVEIVNQMGYTAMVPGNHDFNFGVDRLLEIKSQLNFPVLSSNIYKDNEHVFDDYLIVEKDGKKIGLFGLTTPFALKFTNSRDNGGLTIEDPAKEAKRVLKELGDKADVVILLSHLGDDEDKKLVDEVDGIDLVLCGHYHKLYTSAQKVKDTFIVSGGAWTTHACIGKMYFKDGKISKVSWKTKSTKDKSLEDKKLADIAKKYHDIALIDSQKIVGNAKVELNGRRSQMRSSETNLGNLLTDAMRSIGNADIAIMNGGGIRESIPEGEINLYKLGKVLPFSNSLLTIELKGELIYKAIERGLWSYPSGSNGAFLQVSGISYVFDGSKPAGQRLVEVTKDGKPLEKDKLYKVAINDYLYNGGDYYEEFKDAKIISFGALLKDVLTQYIQEKKEVAPEVEGRITVTNERYK